MRKDCKAKFGDPGDTTPTPSAKSTPRKPKTAKANGETPNKSTGKRKSNKDVPLEHEQDDEEAGSPVKKVKSESIKYDGDGDFDLV